MQLHIINAGSILCDGGGIFGGVPKVLWSRVIQADERNFIRLCMRCLLIDTGDRKILIDSGAGEKHNSKYIENNGIEGTHLFIQSIEKAGFKVEDITDVIHTHLHWDHCGGGTRLDEHGKPVPTFPNARYHCSKTQWENALNANPRESDAYFVDDLLPVQESGQLNLIEEDCQLMPGIELRLFNGHTPGMMVPIVTTDSGKKVVYINDLVPHSGNIGLKWVAAYDLYPVTSMEEKAAFLREVVDENRIVFFEHDLEVECATLKWDEKKGSKLDRKGSLSDFL